MRTLAPLLALLTSACSADTLPPTRIAQADPPAAPRSARTLAAAREAPPKSLRTPARVRPKAREAATRKLADRCASEGFSLLQRGRTRGAAVAFLKAIALVPKHGEAHCGMGLSLLAAGRARKARLAFAAALSCDPSLVEAHAGLAQLEQAFGRYREAERAYAAALALRPGDEALRFARATALRDLGRYRAAKRVLDSLRGSEAFGAKSRIALALLRLRVGGRSARRVASRYLAQALRRNPNSQAARYNAAQLLIHMGRVAEGRRRLAKLAGSESVYGALASACLERKAS